MPGRPGRPRRVDKAPSSSGRATRSTQQVDKDMPPPSSVRSRAIPASTNSTSDEVGAPSREPPRRGARFASPQSIASSAFRRADEEEGPDDEEAETQPDLVLQENGSADVVLQRQSMIENLPELAASSESYIKYTQTASTKNAVNSKLLKVRKQTFEANRSVYDYANPDSFFLDLNWLKEDAAVSEKVLEMARSSIVLANLAAILAAIESISVDNNSDVVSFLEELDRVYPRSFVHGNSGLAELDVALTIRTNLFIARSSDSKGKQGGRALLASVFCTEDAQAESSVSLKNGPFRELAGQSGELVMQACSDRIEEIERIVRETRKAPGLTKEQSLLDKLREEFPLEALFESLISRVFDLYDLAVSQDRLAREDGRGSREEQDEFYDAGEAIPDSISAAESQTIIRPAPDGAREHVSLFRNSTSLRALEEPSDVASPPSNQQQQSPAGRRGPAASAPSDYPISTLDVVEAIHSSAPAQNRAQKRTHQQATQDADGEDDEEDAFQTDERAVDDNKRRLLQASAALPVKKQRRRGANSLPGASQTPRAVTAPMHTSTPQPTAPMSFSGSTMMASGAPGQVNFENIKRQKQALSRARSSEGLASGAPHFHQVKQRYPWSEHDSLVLLELVYKHDARWAHIETQDNHRFERPRNQQAYRDRARNMKVDYLLTDTVLPPCFDSVALSSKEVKKVALAGKNPFRRESEIDADGNAINTEYDPAVHMVAGLSA